MTLTVDPAPSLKHRAGFALAVFYSGLMMSSASIPSPFYHVLQKEMGFADVTMTGIFAIYAMFLLITLLTAGASSDHVGRRPVLSMGFVLLGLSAFLFNIATEPAGLLLARALQGVACALLISTSSATVLDLEPPHRPGLASVFNSTVPMSGLALGALLSGFVMENVADARVAVFDGMALVSLSLAALVWLLPETSPRLPGFARSLRPTLGIPVEVRRIFWQSASATVAAWATIGLFLSLGASITGHFFQISNYMLQAGAVTLVAGSGALSCYLAQGRAPRGVVLYGTAGLAVGTVLMLAAIHGGVGALYVLALACTGSGFGATLFGITMTLVPATPAPKRGALFASVYTLSYIAFGVPVVIAGLVMKSLGLLTTVTLYGLAIVVLSLIAASFYLKRR